MNVSVSNGRHGDHDPVEGRGDGGEPGVLVNLNKVRQACKDEPADANEEDQKTQFFVTILKRVGYGLEA